MHRALTSGRADDTEEVIRNRLQVYAEQSKPVVDFYNVFGKVVRIDATQSILDCYKQARFAAMPECLFVIGPKASGKTTVSQHLCNRTCGTHIDFNRFLLDFGLYDKDDELKTQKFIEFLASLHSRRVVIEGFPNNSF